MNAVVVGAGAWGTAFASLLGARGHDVTLATRDPEQAREIEETGHNPRHLPNADLSGVSATTVDDPGLAGADLHVVAVPSRAFAEVVRALPGAAPVLGLTKGFATGRRRSSPEGSRRWRGSARRAARGPRHSPDWPGWAT
jgi:glycerol-3-phosphate dehydrogenase (NAD(P)+)